MLVGESRDSGEWKGAESELRPSLPEKSLYWYTEHLAHLPRPEEDMNHCESDRGSPSHTIHTNGFTNTRLRHRFVAAQRPPTKPMACVCAIATIMEAAVQLATLKNRLIIRIWSTVPEISLCCGSIQSVMKVFPRSSRARRCSSFAMTG